MSISVTINGISLIIASYLKSASIEFFLAENISINIESDLHLEKIGLESHEELDMYNFCN